MLEPLVPSEVRDRTDRLARPSGMLGTDAFGYDPDAVRVAAAPVAWLYRNYFRVRTYGIDQVPEGRVLLVANHSGQLPFDGLMIGASMILEHEPPRVVRSMVERWVPRLPYVSVGMARVGQVVGTPENCRRLLAQDEAILVFPEGVRGLSKTFDRRYQLARFGSGFMRLAMEMNTPIVPVGVVGAEEQAPALANLEGLGRAFGAPALPISPTLLLPLPVRYHIHFGPPMRFDGQGNEDEEFVRRRIDEVKGAIRRLIDRGLATRPGVFR